MEVRRSWLTLTGPSVLRRRGRAARDPKWMANIERAGRRRKDLNTSIYEKEGAYVTFDGCVVLYGSF